MRTTDVNALNIPDENLIFMSSAIGQSPLFDPKMPASISYGGLGFIGNNALNISHSVF
jgi:predicted metalloendopeptidase